jgi:hypothetical protein
MPIRPRPGQRTLAAAFALSLFACTRPPADPPGVGEQPRQHPERNPADQPTVPPEANSIGAAESPDNPDSPGTTRTPPSAPARPMDERPEPADQAN